MGLATDDPPSGYAYCAGRSACTVHAVILRVHEFQFHVPYKSELIWLLAFSV